MLCGDSSGWRRKACPAPSVSPADDSASEAWPSRCAGKPFRPTPVTGCPRHMSPAAAHIVYRSTTDWSGASVTCVMLVSRSSSAAAPSPNPPTSTTEAATAATNTFSACRTPASSSCAPQATAVAIQAPRLKDRASGTSSASAHPAAMSRGRRSRAPSARPVAATTPKATTVAIPITYDGPNVPTARMSAP